MNLEQSLNETKQMLASGKLAQAREQLLDYLERHASTYRVLHLLVNRRVPDAGIASLGDFVDQALQAFANEPVAATADHDLDYAYQTEQAIRSRRWHFHIDVERATTARERAQRQLEEMRQTEHGEDVYGEYQEAFSRAVTRIAVSEKFKV